MASSGCETEEEPMVSMDEIKKTPLFEGLRITFNAVKTWVENNGSGTPLRLSITGFNKMLSGRDKIILRKVLPGPYLGNIQTFSYLLWKGSKLYGKIGPWKYVGEDWRDTGKSYIILNEPSDAETKQANGKQQEDSKPNLMELPKDDVPDLPTEMKEAETNKENSKEEAQETIQVEPLKVENHKGGNHKGRNRENRNTLHGDRQRRRKEG